MSANFTLIEGGERTMSATSKSFSPNRDMTPIEERVEQLAIDIKSLATSLNLLIEDHRKLFTIYQNFQAKYSEDADLLPIAITVEALARRVTALEVETRPAKKRRG